MKTLTILILVLFALGAVAQEFNVPQDVKLEKAADYDLYESDVIAAVDWLAATPIDAQPDKRKQVNAFLMKWISGSPKVRIEIKPNIVNFLEDADLLMIFIGGWTKYNLQSKKLDDNINGTKAGIEAVIDLYQMNRSKMSKNKGVEKYIKMKEKGTLQEYIEKNA